MSDRTAKNLWCAYLAVMLCWALNAYGYLFQLLHDGELFATKIDGRPYISDFVNVYEAGVLAKQCLHQPTSIYDRQVQSDLQRQLVAPVVPEQTFYNQYPPVMFLVYLPFSLVSMPMAWMMAGSLAAVAAIWAVLIATVPLVPGKVTKFALPIALFASYPTWLSFRLGQTSLLLFPVLLLFWHFLRHRRFVLSAVIGSLLIIKVQYFPIVAAVCFAAGGLRALLCLGGSSCILMAVAAAVVGWKNVESWPHALLSNEGSLQVAGVAVDKMQNMRALMFLWTGNDSQFVHIVSVILWIGCTLTICLAWRRLNVRDERCFYLLASATTLAMLLFSPHTHIQDYMIALLPCAWLYFAANRKEIYLTDTERKVCTAIALSFPFLSWIFFLLLFLFALLKIQPYAIWALLVLIFLTSLLVKQNGPAGSESEGIAP